MKIHQAYQFCLYSTKAQEVYQKLKNDGKKAVEKN